MAGTASIQICRQFRPLYVRQKAPLYMYMTNKSHHATLHTVVNLSSYANAMFFQEYEVHQNYVPKCMNAMLHNHMDDIPELYHSYSQTRCRKQGDYSDGSVLPIH